MLWFFPEVGMEEARITHIQVPRCSEVSPVCKCCNQKGKRIQDNWKQPITLYSFYFLHYFHLPIFGPKTLGMICFFSEMEAES